MCSNALVWLLLLHVLPVSSEHSPSLTGPDGAGGCQLSVSISLTSQQWEVSTSHSTFFKESTDFMLQQWYWREVMVAGQYNKNIILYIYTLSVAEPACYSGKQQCNVENVMPTTIQVRARTELENVATEAMVRQCARCKNRYTYTILYLFLVDRRKLGLLPQMLWHGFQCS